MGFGIYPVDVWIESVCASMQSVTEIEVKWSKNRRSNQCFQILSILKQQCFWPSGMSFPPVPRRNMGQLAETHFAEFGKRCPFCRINSRQSGHRNSAKWASKFGKVGKAVVYICKNRHFENENITWGISDVCTVALTVAKTSYHYDRFAISVPTRSLLLFDLA